MARPSSAPSREKESDSAEPRTASHEALFDMLGFRHGPPRWRIGLEQFVDWATDHVFSNLAAIDIMWVPSATSLSSVAYQTSGGTT